MSHILVVYGTTHGQTAKIAAAVAETLRSQGHRAAIADASRAHPHPGDFDAVVVAASVHGGKYQKPVARWVRSHQALLNDKPTAFLSVCLGVLQRSAEVDRELGAIVETFLRETAWRPTVTKSVAGALLYTRYNWFLRRMMRRIAKQAGGDTDTSRDYEYTDWSDLRSFTIGFAVLVEGRRVAVPAAAVAVAG